MSETGTAEQPLDEPAAPVPQPLKGGVLLKALPAMAGLAWLAALAVAAVALNPPAFMDGAFTLYGWNAPDLMFFLLALASMACVIVAMLRPGLLWPFAAAGLLVPLGTGGRLLAVHPRSDWQGGDLLAAMVFAGSLLLLVEFIAAVPRFNGIVRSSQSLAQDERTHVNRFIARYLVLSVGLVLLYTGLGFALAGIVFPFIGDQISVRMAQGIEMRTAIGITVFSMVLLSIPILVRMVIDGFSSRADPDDEEAAA